MVDIVAAYLKCVCAVKICCNNIYHRGMQFYRFYNNTVL